MNDLKTTLILLLIIRLAAAPSLNIGQRYIASGMLTSPDTLLRYRMVTAQPHH